MTKAQYLATLIAAAHDGTFPSSLPDGLTCMYRGPGGKKCAAGLLIPDEKYTPRMEHKSVEVLNMNFPGDIDIPEGMTIAQVQMVQAIHDTFASFRSWQADKFVEAVRAETYFQGVEPEPVVAQGGANS